MRTSPAVTLLAVALAGLGLTACSSSSKTSAPTPAPTPSPSASVPEPPFESPSPDESPMPSPTGPTASAQQLADARTALRDLATAEETHLTDHGSYVSFVQHWPADIELHVAAPVVVGAVTRKTEGYCLVAVPTGTSTPVYFDSEAGGLIGADVTPGADCQDLAGKVLAVA